MKLGRSTEYRHVFKESPARYIYIPQVANERLPAQSEPAIEAVLEKLATAAAAR